MARAFPHPSSLARVQYGVIYHAMDDLGWEDFDMVIPSRAEQAAVTAAVNEGIDSHLEACHVPARGDSYKHDGRGRLVCVVSKESLPVLVRRLGEQADETGPDLASSILYTLGIRENGTYKRPEE